MVMRLTLLNKSLACKITSSCYDYFDFHHPFVCNYFVYLKMYTVRFNLDWTCIHVCKQSPGYRNFES